MGREILEQYIDACELIKETEQDIEKLKRRKKMIVQESVTGSNPEYPYEQKHFHLEGSPCIYSNDRRIRQEEKILEERKWKAEEIKIQAEAYMNQMPVRMQRIVRYKIIEGMTWQQAAAKMGKRCTEESIRKEFTRWMKEK